MVNVPISYPLIIPKASESISCGKGVLLFCQSYVILRISQILILYIYIINTYTFEKENYNHQVGISLCTWDLNQQEPVHRGY